MAIPNYQKIMLPLLQLAGDQAEHLLRDAIEQMANHFQLDEQERRLLLPSGRRTIIANRVGWAKTYLSKAGLLELVGEGHFKITARGLDALKQKPAEINVRFLKQFPEFVEFQKRARKDKRATATVTDEEPSETLTPRELIDDGYNRIRDSLAQDLLVRVKQCDPHFFEQLVVDLLVAMGYGGSLKDAGEAIGGSGDEGIDGIIKEDKLGMDVVYIQAKRWEGTVGRPEVQKFVGALLGHGAKKGVFITTSTFSREATEYAEASKEHKVVLIDGEQLAELMIDNNIGVSTRETYEIKEIDADYFIE
jgi:restriction system protein